MPASPWWRIGWRNLGRNSRRTVLTATGLAVGYWSVVVITGMADGLVADMVRTATGILSGQVQAHAPEYLPDRTLYETIGGAEGTDVPALLHAVEAEPGVLGAAPRVYAGGLVSSGATTVGVLLLGVDPAREDSVSRLAAALVEGRLPTPGARELLIGRELARQLDVAPGGELVVVAPAADGSLGNDLFRVSGLYATGIAELDAGTAVGPLAAIQELLALAPGRVHEIAIRIGDPWAAPGMADSLTRRLSAAGAGPIAVRPWTTFRPELVDYANLSSGSMWIVVLIVFAMAVFGVANTLLMTTFERRREFALLLALGATPGGIVRAVLAEAVALGVISILLGVAITVPVLVWWHHDPIDLSRLFGDFTMAGALVRPVLRTDYPLSMCFYAAGALLLTALLAALYPAYRATRVPPADTLAGR